MHIAALPNTPPRPDTQALRDRIRWSTIPFFAFHAIAIVLAIVVGFSWAALAWCLALYYSRMLFCALGYHRYFAHRTFKTGRVRQFLLAFAAQTTVQKGVLWWAAHHRNHHSFSDDPRDPHSVKQRGFWWAHLGWILAARFERTDFRRIRDFAKYPELRWLNRHHWVPPLALALALFAVGGPVALAWGFFVSTVCLWHGTFAVNSLAHMIGRRRYATSDDSRNSVLIALITCGEGWHNNHHHFQHTARQGFRWWEFDTGYYALRVASWMGLVRDVVKTVPARAAA